MSTMPLISAVSPYLDVTNPAKLFQKLYVSPCIRALPPMVSIDFTSSSLLTVFLVFSPQTKRSITLAACGSVIFTSLSITLVVN